MRFPHEPGGFGLAGSIFADILAGLMFIICFIVVVGLLFVLVRFLLVATKAAEIYVAKNGESRPAVAEPAAAGAKPTTTTVPTAKTPVPTAKTPITTPPPATTRTRTTKTPPAS